MAKVKELAERIQQAKEKMQKESQADEYPRLTSCTRHSGDGTCLCLYSYEATGFLKWMQSTVCHAEVARLGSKTDFILDHIQTMKGWNNLPHSEEEGIKLLQYYMDHPIFSKSFHEHDAKKAYEERIMVRNLEGLPSNATMFCLIGTRALWEAFQNEVPHRFSVMLNKGFTPDEAFILSYFFKHDQGNKFKYSPIAQSGHSCIPTRAFTEEHLSNFLNYKMTYTSNKTLGEGGDTCGWNHRGAEKGYYSVDLLFAGTPATKPRDDWDWMALQNFKSSSLTRSLDGNNLTAASLKNFCAEVKEKYK